MLAPWKKSYDQPRKHIKKQRYYFANKGLSSQSCGFSSSHLWVWELDYKESWSPKNWCFWTVLLEKTLERPLDGKEIQPVHPKGNQSWIFIGRTNVEVETAIHWPPDANSWFSLPLKSFIISIGLLFYCTCCSWYFWVIVKHLIRQVEYWILSEWQWNTDTWLGFCISKQMQQRLKGYIFVTVLHQTCNGWFTIWFPFRM